MVAKYLEFFSPKKFLSPDEEKINFLLLSIQNKSQNSEPLFGVISFFSLGRGIN